MSNLISSDSSLQISLYDVTEWDDGYVSIYLNDHITTHGRRYFIKNGIVYNHSLTEIIDLNKKPDNLEEERFLKALLYLV